MTKLQKKFCGLTYGELLCFHFRFPVRRGRDFQAPLVLASLAATRGRPLENIA